MHSKLLVIFLVAALIAWRIYMRMRRSFGRQRIRPRRLWVRIGILALIAVLLVLAASRDLLALGALLAGGACGAVLAVLGLRFTQFETTSEGRFYTPHTYFGLAVTVVFLGRLAYDFALFSHGLPGIRGAPPPALAQYNPLTLSISGLFIAYYLGYSIGVVRKTRASIEPGPAIPSGPR